jgi:hypothetical protein
VTTVLIEEQLRFEFGQSWQVEKYDEHSAYRDGIEHLKERIPCRQCLNPRDVGTKAVDFVGRKNGELYLIEVKDFRGHEVENRRRVRGDLAIEVALKVRDTLAALVGALHRRAEPTLRPFAESAFQMPPLAPKVILWLEQDVVRLEQRGDPTLELRTELLRSLRWLNPHVWVASQETVWGALDLSVRRLPDRVHRVRKIVKKDGSISRDDFCRAWSATPQAAGIALVKLCDEAHFLRRDPDDADRFLPGLRWGVFDEEPA